MPSISTVAAPASPAPGPAPVPVPGPPSSPPAGSGTANESVRLKVAHWMESHFGKAYLPIAMAAGGAVGAGVGFLTLGPVGAVVGGAAGAMLGGVLVFAD